MPLSKSYTNEMNLVRRFAQSDTFVYSPIKVNPTGLVPLQSIASSTLYVGYDISIASE